jgi:hypothetical protein
MPFIGPGDVPPVPQTATGIFVAQSLRIAPFTGARRRLSVNPIANITKIAVSGIDLGKNVCSVVGLDTSLIDLVAKLRTCIVII